MCVSTAAAEKFPEIIPLARVPVVESKKIKRLQNLPQRLVNNQFSFIPKKTLYQLFIN